MTAGRLSGVKPLSKPMLLIGPPGTNFNEILIEIHLFSFKKFCFSRSSGKWRPFILGLNMMHTDNIDKTDSDKKVAFYFITVTS